MVEDEPVTRMQLVSHFQGAGCRVSSTDNGEDALRQLGGSDITLVLLDIKLPGRDGLAITREIRANSDIGIILVTAKQEQVDRLEGLDSGADDYVTKPFDPRELVSRARNLLRRVQVQQTQRRRNHLRRFDTWTLDLNTRSLITNEGASQQISQGEFQLLLALMDNAGEVMNRDQLMTRIRNREWYPDDRYIDVLVAQLRRKLGERAGTARIITTIHGTGYLFTPDVS